jgi:hypothetical protein
MGSLDRPKLQALPVQRVEQDGQVFATFEVPGGGASRTVLIPLDSSQRVVRLFDGRSSIGDLRAWVLRVSGLRLSIESPVAELDRAMLLDGPTYQTFRDVLQRVSLRRASRPELGQGGPDSA